MRVRKLLRRRMVTTGFADRGLFGAETESARKGLPGRSISVVECDCSGADATPSPSRRGLKPITGTVFITLLRQCNTVPIEEGTETLAVELDHFPFELMQPRPHREGD